MINSIKDAYPDKDQFKEYSVECECNNLLNVLISDFETRIKKSINQTDFIENEIKRLLELRDNIDQSGISHSGFYDRTIKLFPFFKSGWDRLVSGLGFVATNNEYKFHPDLLLIECVFNQSNHQKNYFQKLSKIAINSIIDGMAHAKYYYWLREGEFKKDKNETDAINLPTKEDGNSIKGGNQIQSILQFKNDSVPLIYDILKNYFSADDQDELEEILKTGCNCSRKLLFKDNGNRLADFFKKLIEHDYIIGCDKQRLQEWVISNFKYTFWRKGEEYIKEYIMDTVHRTISRNDTPCKYPIIEIPNGLIEICTSPKNKNHNK